MAVFSAISSVVGANKQAKAVKSAADTAAQVQQNMYDQTREDLTPFRETGTNALGVIANLSGANGAEAAQNAMAGFTASPGYSFQLSEGQRALDASGAAKGMSLSGAQLKAATQYGQGLASQEYGNYYNRLYGLAGLGQSAAATTGQAGQAAANAQSSIAVNEGNQLSSITAGQTAGINSGINNLFAVAGYGNANGWFSSPSGATSGGKTSPATLFKATA